MWTQQPTATIVLEDQQIIQIVHVATSLMIFIAHKSILFIIQVKIDYKGLPFM